MKKNIFINPTYKEFVLESLKLITIDSNEAERSTAVIGDVVKIVILSLINSGIKANFKAQNIYFTENKKDFITDFELYANKSLFHIIEAKGQTGLASAKDQITTQLKKSSCENGCITDGFTWQFVRLNDAQELEYVGNPLLLEVHLDIIINKIILTIPELC